MIWEFADLVGRRLVIWSAASIAAGALLLVLAADPLWRGIGVQALVWGLIDGAIGLVGIRGAKRDRLRGRGDPEAATRDARKLRRLLLVNAGLDVGYVLFGLWLVLAGASDRFGVGTGWGIVVQGTFLLVFDAVHARWVPAAGSLLPHGIDLFAGPEHGPYRSATVDGASDSRPGRPLAVLVHGFPGTPAEMRPLAHALEAAGWEVVAPLLPGMGPAIRTLGDMTHGDWLDAVERAADRGSSPRPLLLVGYSAGAALSLVASRRVAPDGLVLLAPFWWPRPWWSRLSWVVRAFLPTGARPFARLDLDAADVRRGIASFLPGLDLDDPAVRASVREIRLPIGIFTELFRLSDRVVEAADGHALPTLVVQGSADEVVLPARTRELVARFSSEPRLVEVDAAHDLVGPRAVVTETLNEEVVAFAGLVLRGRGPEAAPGTAPSPAAPDVEAA